MTFLLKRADLSSIPFETCANILTPVDLEAWAVEHNLKLYESWFLPQLVAYFGQMRLRVDDIPYSESFGKCDPKQFWLENIKDNPRHIGMWRIATRLPRSHLVGTQIKNPNYSGLVPLILAGFKKYRNVPYSSWSKAGVEHIIGTELFEAATAEVPEVTREELLVIRDKGLTYKSGKQVGQVKKPTSAWSLTGIQDTVIGGLPRLTQTMLTQIWVAHPTVRTDLMILNPLDWDTMPQPLLATEVIVDVPKNKAKPLIQKVSDLPW